MLLLVLDIVFLTTFDEFKTVYLAMLRMTFIHYDGGALTVATFYECGPRWQKVLLYYAITMDTMIWYRHYDLIMIMILCSHHAYK